MKPLIVLLASFLFALLTLRVMHGNYETAFAARIAMSAMLLFTAIAHFAFTKGMTMMVPPFIPFKELVVYLTGLFEIAAALGLLIPSVQYLTALMLIIFFILLLPANIYAAVKHINYQKGNYDGAGLKYLWFRVPLQIFFIAWLYFAAIKF
ncbi:MAG: hypothetical protein QM737_23140 [Ferruginibacter sp.]